MEGWNQAELHIALVYIRTKSGSDLQLGLIFIAGGRTRARIARFREH
jgi:small basic protein